MNQNNNNKFYRDQTWEQINLRFNHLEKKVDQILNNHLPHLDRRIDKVEQKLAYWSGGIVVAVTVAQWLLNRL